MILSFDKNQIEALMKPCVYVFYTDTRCLYVGMGRSASRPIEPGHHVRSKLEGVATKLTILQCRSFDDARDLERQLICKLCPDFNRQHSSVHLGFTRQYQPDELGKILTDLDSDRHSPRPLSKRQQVEAWIAERRAALPLFAISEEREECERAAAVEHLQRDALERLSAA
jgi:hypothetical protein